MQRSPLRLPRVLPLQPELPHYFNLSRLPPVFFNNYNTNLHYLECQTPKMTSPCIEECATFFAPLSSPLREGQIQLPATCEQKNSLSLSAKTRSFPPPCPLTCGLCFSQVGNGVKFVLQSFCIGICQPKRSRMFKELLVLQPPRWLVGKQSHTKK